MLKILEKMQDELISQWTKAKWEVEATTCSSLEEFYALRVIGLSAQISLIKDLIDIAKNNT